MPYFYPWTYIGSGDKNGTAGAAAASKNETAKTDEKNSTLRDLNEELEIEAVQKKVKKELADNNKDELDKEEEIIGIENSGYDNSNMINNLGFLFIIITLSFVNVAILPIFWII